MWLIQDSNWKGRALWRLSGGLATTLQNWISCTEQKMREAHITRRETSFYLFMIFIEKISNRKLKHSLIENGWCFFPWSSKGITGKMPWPCIPPRGKREKRLYFSPHCGDETTTYPNRAKRNAADRGSINAKAFEEKGRRNGVFAFAMKHAAFISTARWKFGLFLQFSPWRTSWLRHFVGYSFAASK